MLKSLPSCYFKPTLNSYNLTSLSSAWILFLSFCNIAVNLGQILFCHWNLNGLAAHNFTKVSLLQALSLTHDYDTICLLETFLDSLISNKDERINIKGYNLLRANHPSNKKRGRVFI